MSLYAPNIVVEMRSKISLFIVRLSHITKKERKKAILIRDIDIARLMTYVQQVQEEKLKDKKDFCNKRAKISSNDIGKKELGMESPTFSVRVIW